MYASSHTQCSKCTTNTCIPGTYKTSCLAKADSECTACTNAPLEGNFTWTDECLFTCADGLYYSSTLNRCLKCNLPNCTLGTTANPCTDSDNNPGCIPCPNTPSGAEFTWKEGCNFQCNSGTYYSTGTDECILCNRPNCPPGQYAPQCTDQINNPTCTVCPVKPVNGPFNWTSGCNFACTNGTYLSSGNKCIPCSAGAYLSSSGCSACTTTTCPPGRYRTHCTTGSVQDANCLECKTPVTGPFSWTSQCAFACTNHTYLNSTHCTRCTPQCPNGSFVASRCNATSDTVCRACDVIPKPPASFNWTGGCNFRCVAGMVWNSTHCVDEAAAEMVTVKATTNIQFNNTVKEVCNNLDSLLQAVISAMELLYGVPFTGNISSINNKTTQDVCAAEKTSQIANHSSLNNKSSTNNLGDQNHSITRRLLQASNSTQREGTNVVTDTTASNTIPKGIATAVDPITKIQQVEKAIALSSSALNPQEVKTDTINAPQSSPPPADESNTMSIGVIIGICAGIIVVFVIAVCMYYKKTKKASPVVQPKTQQAAFSLDASTVCLKMPRIHTPEKQN